MDSTMSAWISVEDRLPEDLRDVLVYAEHLTGGVRTVERAYCNQYGDWQEVNGKTVTHWMPLPEPPKEE